MGTAMQQKHFVLVHGSCHGAWCWFKLKPRLEAAGHRVTALDLAASGRDKRNVVQVQTVSEYIKPLLDFMETEVSPEEKVILVGHSFGGLDLAFAMEKFPEIVSVAVFLTAFMPDTVHVPAYVLERLTGTMPAESWLDTQFLPYDSTNNDSESSMFFGPKFLSTMLYQLCSSEDIALGEMLLRPASLFIKSLSTANNFSEKGYGSVKRVYIVCEEDRGIPKEYQWWMINNQPVTEVKVIKDVDHMAMLSNPQALCQCLVDIALKYA